MENINSNKLSEKLNKFFGKTIKLSYLSNQSVIVMTKDDKCYEFKRDNFKSNIKNSLIALSDDKSKVKSLIEESFVKELSYRQIIDFKNSLVHLVALTVKGEVLCWGHNVYGVLGNGTYDLDTFEPFNDEQTNKSYFNQISIDEFVIDICCGAYHTLVLTFSGDIYSWGRNDYGQINHELRCGIQLTPFKLNLFNGEKLKAISCGSYHSLALTTSGQVSRWGKNIYGSWRYGNELNYNNYLPSLIELSELSKVIKISSGSRHDLLLTSDGDIYVWAGKRNRLLRTINQKNFSSQNKMRNPEKFTHIASHFSQQLSVVKSVNSIFYKWLDCEEEILNEANESKFKSFGEIFHYYSRITYEPVQGKVVQFSDEFIRNGKYEYSFYENKMISRGGYGKVFEASYKRNKNCKFAIKKIKYKTLNEKEFMKDLETSPIIYELNHENIVQYFDVWLENDFLLKNGIKTHTQNCKLYIQMELCDKSLNDFIDEIKNNSLFCSNGTLTFFGYYIACQIFIEILNGVNYLHKRNPPIIHRDLNPWNILLKIRDNSFHNSCVKIADLGLATLHEHVNQSHSPYKGNLEFIAPEVNDDTGSYDTRADIHSLGIVLQRLFFIQINRNYKIQNGNHFKSVLMNKYQEISNLCKRMTQRRVAERPANINEILKEKSLWTLNANDMNLNENFDKIFNSYKSDESFVSKLLMHQLFHDDSLLSRQYESHFFEKRIIGNGKYGDIFEVNAKYGNTNNAIKIIFRDQYETNNIEILSFPSSTNKLSENTVIYFDVWLGRDLIFENTAEDTSQNFILYIAIELFNESLNETICEIKGDLNFYSKEFFLPLDDYISSGLFIEILEGVNYLIEQSLPLIHENLYPLSLMLKIKKRTYGSVEAGVSSFSICFKFPCSRERGYDSMGLKMGSCVSHTSSIHNTGKKSFREENRNNECQSESIYMNDFQKMNNQRIDHQISNNEEQIHRRKTQNRMELSNMTESEYKFFRGELKYTATSNKGNPF